MRQALNNLQFSGSQDRAAARPVSEVGNAGNDRLGVVTTVAAASIHPVALRPALGHFNTATTGSLPEAPTLVVAPFAGLGDGPDAKTYAMGLTEELLTALPRFKEIQVFGRETSEALSSEVGAAHVRGALGADYLLTGGVRLSGNHVRVTARVLDTQTNAILWSQDYDDDLNSKD